MKRSRHVKNMGLDIGCICVGQRCGKSRWEDRCTHLCPCMDCGSSWMPQPGLEDSTKNKEV